MNLLIDPKNIYTVEKLNNSINLELQQSFGTVYVEGEISNLARPASGHLYFTLKDKSAQIRCALFKGYRRFIKTKIENGQKVLVKAKISIYVPRGDYQLIVEHAYPTGLGALQQAYEELKNKLQQEGLFKPEYKKPIPKLPKNIFIVTSATGAAIKDILTTLNRRFPSIPVKIIPTLVQGETAAVNLTTAVKLADKLSDNKQDVIILSRGGGSLEDLWAFNDENLARAIFKSNTAVITGIGHEVDFTIADFVADLRAATPTAAAENASPNWQDYFNNINKLEQSLYKIFSNKLITLVNNIKYLKHRLLQQHPENKLNNQAQLLDDLNNKLNYIWDRKFNTLYNKIKILNHKLEQNTPSNYINIQNNNIKNLNKLLNNNINNILKFSGNKIQNLSTRLNSVNPLDILSRGFSILKTKDNKVITSKTQVQSGDKITADLSHGSIECEVIN